MKPLTPRGPRLVDPFARDVFIGSLRSPLHPAEDAELGDPFEAPTLVRRPAPTAPRATSAPPPPAPAPSPPAPHFEPAKHSRIDAELTQTLVRALPAPVFRPPEAKPPSASPPSPPLEAQPSRLRPLIAALIVVAVVLAGARLFLQRRALQSAAAARPSTVPTSSTAPARPLASSNSTTQEHEAKLAPAPAVPAREPGKTRERQAVDLIARGAYAEAAAVYEFLSRHDDADPTFREAARIARRKAARSN